LVHRGVRHARSEGGEGVVGGVGGVSLFTGVRTVRSNDVHGMQLCEFTYSPQASAKHFQQCAEFLPLRNRGLGTLAVTILPVPFARGAAATACAGKLESRTARADSAVAAGAFFKTAARGIANYSDALFSDRSRFADRCVGDRTGRWRAPRRGAAFFFALGAFIMALSRA
jgi:hypothetical protein